MEFLLFHVMAPLNEILEAIDLLAQDKSISPLKKEVHFNLFHIYFILYIILFCCYILVHEFVFNFIIFSLGLDMLSG